MEKPKCSMKNVRAEVIEREVCSGVTRVVIEDKVNSCIFVLIEALLSRYLVVRSSAKIRHELFAADTWFGEI